MSFKLKAGAETDGLPTVTLAGTKYFVARLPLRHRIKVQLLLPRMNAITARFRATFAIADSDTAEQIKQKLSAGGTFEMAEEDYSVFIEIASRGLLPLYPDATPEALLEETIDFEELYAAWPVIVGQGASRSHAPVGEM